MNIEEFKEIDIIMRLLRNCTDNFMGMHRNEIIKETGFDKQVVIGYLRYLTDIGYVVNPWEVEEDTEEIYAKLTPAGNVFFSESSFEEKMSTKINSASGVTVNFNGNNHGNLVVGETLKDVVLKMTSENHQESAELLKSIQSLIEDSKNPEAAIAFEEFNKQLLEPKQNKTLINILWKTIETTIPHIPGIVEAGHKLLNSLQ